MIRSVTGHGKRGAFHVGQEFRGNTQTGLVTQHGKQGYYKSFEDLERKREHGRYVDRFMALVTAGAPLLASTTDYYSFYSISGDAPLLFVYCFVASM